MRILFLLSLFTVAPTIPLTTQHAWPRGGPAVTLWPTVTLWPPGGPAVPLGPGGPAVPLGPVTRSSTGGPAVALSRNAVSHCSSSEHPAGADEVLPPPPWPEWHQPSWLLQLLLIQRLLLLLLQLLLLSPPQGSLPSLLLLLLTQQHLLLPPQPLLLLLQPSPRPLPPLLQRDKTSKQTGPCRWQGLA